MKTLFKTLVIALCCLVCCSPFISVHAEESDELPPFSPFFYPSPTNYLTSAQQSWVCSHWDIVSQSSYAFSYQDSNQFVVVTAWDGSTGRLWRLHPDGSYLNDGTTIDYVMADPNNVAAVYVDRGNYLGKGVIDNLDLIDSCSSLPGGFSGCPVAMNEVLSNDYVTSLLSYIYRAGVEQFIIYRVQHTFDVMGYPNRTIFNQIGEFKGYVLTTPSNVVQTFVYDYNRPTILSGDNGYSWQYQYMDILDSHYVSDWEMVLHWSCLDTRYSSDFEALENVNSSIQSTIQQNATLISQNSSMIGQNETMIEQNESIIANGQLTNDLIENGTSRTDDVLASSQYLYDNVIDITSSIGTFEVDMLESSLSLFDSVYSDFSGIPFPSIMFIRDEFTNIWNNNNLLPYFVSFMLLSFLIFVLGGKK